MSTTMQSMPQYQSHKTVRAMKIAAIEWTAGGARLRSQDGTEIAVDASYMTKHQPKVGGYLVMYDDGYMSWSPSEAFEAGYTKL